MKNWIIWILFVQLNLKQLSCKRIKIENDETERIYRTRIKMWQGSHPAFSREPHRKRLDPISHRMRRGGTTAQPYRADDHHHVAVGSRLQSWLCAVSQPVAPEPRVCDGITLLNADRVCSISFCQPWVRRRAAWATWAKARGWRWRRNCRWWTASRSSSA